MTKELLEKRLGELVQQKESKGQQLSQIEKVKEQVVADLNALGGAIQDCEYWLKELQPKEAEVAQ
jgi:hypothetical protein